MLKKIVLIAVIAGIALFALLQVVPLGRDRTNPAVVQEPNWESPETRALAQRACFDCHSNETAWPWYSNIAPASWMVAMDVGQGRSNMNFSDWGQMSQDADDVIRQIERGSMPPSRYTAIHPEARLTAEEQAQLIAGFQKSLQ